MTIVTFLPRRFMASRVMTDTFFRAVACAPVMLFIVAMAVVAKHRRMTGAAFRRSKVFLHWLCAHARAGRRRAILEGLDFRILYGVLPIRAMPVDIK